MAPVHVRSRAAFFLSCLFATAACSSDRTPASPPSAPSSPPAVATPSAAAPIPGLAPAPAPAATGTAPAPNLGLVPLPPLPDDTAARLLKLYKLSMPRLQQWSKAQSALNKVTARYPDMLPKMQAGPAPKTLDQMVAMIGGEPRIRRTLTAVGTNPRDYVLTMIAMQQAMQGYARVSEGKPLPPDLPPAIAENIVFVQKNITAIQQVLATITK